MRYYRCRRGRRMGPKSMAEQESQGRGRPLKEIMVDDFPHIEKLVPQPTTTNEEVILTIAEFEAIRLVDKEGLNQDEAGGLMNVSRGTIWRLLDSGREKLSQVLVDGKTLIIEKQDFCEEPKNK